jgi:RNA polymerase sigma-70 factor (ECF subfamily)
MINLLNSLISRAIPHNISDEDLVSEYLLTQRMSIFDVFHQRYSSKVYAKCISILKNATLAQDAVQEVFVKVLLNISKFKGKSKFSTWLYSTTYNFCIDETRRLKQEDLFSGADIENIKDELVYQDDIDDNKFIEVQVNQVSEVLDEMRPYDKSILQMKYLDGMSINEIEEVANKSESTVKL